MMDKRPEALHHEITICSLSESVSTESSVAEPEVDDEPDEATSACVRSSHSFGSRKYLKHLEQRDRKPCSLQ